MKGPESGWAVIQESFTSLGPLVELYRRQLELPPGLDRALRDGLDRLLHRLHRFVSCALLAYEHTESQRCARIRSLGFRFEPVEVIGWDQIVLIELGLAGWIFLVTSIMAVGLNEMGWAAYLSEVMIAPTGLQGSLAWSAAAFLFQGGGVLVVLCAKRWLRRHDVWPVPRAPLASRERRWLLYFGMGALGLAAGMLALIAVSPWASEFQPRWGLLAAPTAFLLAYHIDTHPDAAYAWLQTLLQGAVTGLVTWACSMTFLEIEGWWPETERDAVFVGFLVVQAALTGGFIGYWGPRRYREYVFGEEHPDRSIAAGLRQALS